MKEPPPNGLDIKAIHPRNGDKYSPNLHKWLTNTRRRTWLPDIRLYRNPEMTLYIGHIDQGILSGSNLAEVLYKGSKAKIWGYMGIDDLVEVFDFWPRYMADGRCAIDPEHAISFIDDKTRWLKHDGKRTCQWCWKVTQELIYWTETVEHREWRNALPGAHK